MALTDTLLPADAIRLRQEDRATMDFIKNVKTVSGAVLGAAAQRHYRQELAERAKNGQPAPRSVDEVGDILNPVFAWQADRFISRQSQEMLWSRLFAAITEDAERWETWLRTPVANPKGSLRLNPSLRYPDYYQIDYHVQPGGMHKQPLIPIVLEVGQAVYHSGANDKWGIQYGVANAIPSGKYGRILDLGCSFAHSTIPIKERFPDAEVHGIDMSGPLISYGHRLAESYGFALHLSQQNAEDLDFPDNHFDVVTCCILFHEVPDSAATNIIREAYRVLKPGGMFQVGDVPPYRTQDPYRAFFSDWQTENNGEPYWRQAALRDLPGLFRATGFRSVDEPKLNQPNVNPIPWITRGWK